jgi:hypothetical protein
MIGATVMVIRGCMERLGPFVMTSNMTVLDRSSNVR